MHFKQKSTVSVFLASSRFAETDRDFGCYSITKT